MKTRDEKFSLLTIGLTIKRRSIHHIVIKLSSIVSFFSTIISSNYGSLPARDVISSRALVRVCVHVFENRADTEENVLMRSAEDSQTPVKENETKKLIFKIIFSIIQLLT